MIERTRTHNSKVLPSIDKDQGSPADGPLYVSVGPRKSHSKEIHEKMSAKDSEQVERVDYYGPPDSYERKNQKHENEVSYVISDVNEKDI
jgi:hypothetical protein